MSRLTSEAAILADLRQVFRDALGVEPLTPIEPETRFFADLGLASIDAVVLGEAIQNRFQRRLPFDQLLAELGKREERDLAIIELIAFLKNYL
jgi:acyl carrier protein